MNEEQLKEASEKEALSDSIAYEERYDSFIKGARWLMSLPLADRLSKREKEDIINYYNPWCDEPNLYMQGVKAGLSFAFGRDLFTDKT